jgi:broad specificity phosphatase PhoE
LGFGGLARSDTMLILLRHARTPNNAQARLQGQIDSPLDEVGFEQARRAGEAISARWDVDAVVTSSLARTKQTAESAGLGDLPTTVDDRWREIDFGDYDERRIGEVMAELGGAWQRDIEYVPTNGESMGSMHRRIGEALPAILERSRDENIVVVTHATPIKSVVGWILGGDAEAILKMRINLASITSISNDHQGVLLEEFNWRPNPADL